MRRAKARKDKTEEEEMPRFTEESNINEFVIQDRISGDEVTLFYRTPTAEEHIRYSKEKIIRKGNKIKDQMTESMIKYAAEICTGFKKGSFAKTVDGKPVCYASSPNDPDYDPNWKQMLRAHAADLLILLGMHVFEPVSAQIKFEDEDENLEKN